MTPDAPDPPRRWWPWLWSLFEGDLAFAPAAERAQLRALQLKLMKRPMATMMYGLCLAAGTKSALVASGHLPGKAAPWAYAAGTALLVLLAWACARRGTPLALRSLCGLLFLLAWEILMLGPMAQWHHSPAIALGPALLLPLIALPLMVRPLATLVVAALSGVGIIAWILLEPDLRPEVQLAMVLLMVMSVCAGLLMRAARASYALYVQREMRKLWQSASTDPLTGVLNRRGGLDAARAKLAREGSGPVALAFLDVDHFKQFNDRHGHAVGDELLSGLGQVLLGRAGEDDVAMRLGGEEFACLMPGADLAAARRHAERIAKTYRDRYRAYASTLSVGIAMRRPGETLESLLSRADAALYEAKRAGRDRVEVADGDD